MKPLDEFYNSPKYDGGYSAYCKICASELNKLHRKPAKANEYMKRRYAENPDVRERVKAKAKTYRLKDLQDPAKFRAKKFFDVARMNVAPDVTKEYLETLFRSTGVCQCCGKTLQLEYEDRAGRQYRSNPDAPSVDRVNNREGYTRANIAIICWRCNFRKTDLTIEDLTMMADYIRRCGNVR